MESIDGQGRDARTADRFPVPLSIRTTRTTARTLAPSEEVLDTPLSPPPLGDKPGYATGHSGIYPAGTCTRRSLQFSGRDMVSGLPPASRTSHPKWRNQRTRTVAPRRTALGVSLTKQQRSTPVRPPSLA